MNIKSANTYTLERAREYESQAFQLPEEERPAFHFTPWIGWMNDPNGFCFYNGQYHLFYQYYPYECIRGTRHWGHAVSNDLLHWSYLPCALAPDTQADASGCFSGSALPLPDGRLMLVYTGVQPNGSDRNIQAQCIAIGDGIDFVKCSENPVIDASSLPEGYSIHDFRDPKVWQKADGTFAMVVANLHQERQGTILLFESKDALHWHFVTEIASCNGEYGRMWECPDFFPLNGQQVLLTSPQEMAASDTFQQGYGTIAILGNYDSEARVFLRQSVFPVDSGLDFYAPQTVLSPDNRRILIGWLANWESVENMPSVHPWFTRMSLPRELSIRNGQLYQVPVQEIETLWQDMVSIDAFSVSGTTVLPGISGSLLDLTLVFDLAESQSNTFTVQLNGKDEHFVQIQYDRMHELLTLDRSHAGFPENILHVRLVHIAPDSRKLSLRLILDEESLELFINEGQNVLSSLLPSDFEANSISLDADAPLIMSAEAHHLSR